MVRQRSAKLVETPAFSWFQWPTRTRIGVNRRCRGILGTVLGINLGTGCARFSAGFTEFGGDAEAVEALVCKTGLSGFESRRYLHF